MAMAMSIDQVRADLARRCAAIRGGSADKPVRDIAPDIDHIRAVAHRAGMNPVVTVAHFLASALSRGERGAPIREWLALLADAIACERQDVAACDAFAAACSVRLAA